MRWRLPEDAGKLMVAKTGRQLPVAVFKQLVITYQRESTEENASWTGNNRRSSCHRPSSQLSTKFPALSQLAIGTDGTPGVSAALASHNTTTNGIVQKFFFKPKLDVSLEPVVSSSDLRDAHKRYLSTNEPDSAFAIYPNRTQGLSVTARRGEINHCMAKLTVEREPAGNLLWESIEQGRIVSRSRRHLIPEEEEILVVWRAFKKPQEEAFLFNTPEDIHFDPHKVKSIGFEITFLSERGRLHKKSYRYIVRLSSWDEIKMEEVKD